MSRPSDEISSDFNGLTRLATAVRDLARDAPLSATLDDLALVIENEDDGLVCGFCVLDPEGRLVTESCGPSLSENYKHSLLGSDLGELTTGPCAYAIRDKKAIFVEDIASDPRWVGSSWLKNSLANGFQSCQSTPIFDSTGAVLGTFIIYSRRSLAAWEPRAISDIAAHLAAIAIEWHRQKASFRENGQRVQLAIEAAALGTWDWHFSDRRFVGSDRCKQMLGIQKDEEMTYNRFLAAIHSDDRDRTAQALGTSAACHLEVRCVWPDGSIHWITLLGKESDSDNAERPAVMRGVAMNVTERKQAEDLAALSIERFRFLGDFLPEKIFTATPSGETDHLNQQWSTYTGLPLSEVLRLGWREFVHPDDLEEKMLRWTQAIKTVTPFEFEHRFRRADGTYRWHLSRAQPMQRSDGTVSMWVGSNTDVDDLKRTQFNLRESEGRGRLAMEAAGFGFWDWDIGKSIKWSPEHNRMLGIAPELREGSLEVFMNHVHPQDRRTVSQALERAQEERVDFEAEFRSSGHDGVIRWLSSHGRAYYDEQTGRPVRMIGVIRDITERKKFDERLRSNQEELRAALAAAELAREEAEAAGRAKDQFLAVLSHELRTPLAPVLVAVSVMGAEKHLSPDVRDALEMIQRNIKVEARLIEDLLDLTRITQNKIELHLEPLDLHVALQQALETCGSDLESQHLHLQLTLSAQKSRVEGDFARLQQVFWNLIKNAVKFTGKGGQISIRSYNIGPRIFVEISDTGIGILPDALSRIFKPFEQGGPDLVQRFGGLGLGLAISKGTVEAHHGYLTAKSKGQDKGATFILELATIS